MCVAQASDTVMPNGLCVNSSVISLFRARCHGQVNALQVCLIRSSMVISKIKFRNKHLFSFKNPEDQTSN